MPFLSLVSLLNRLIVERPEEVTAEQSKLPFDLWAAQNEVQQIPP